MPYRKTNEEIKHFLIHNIEDCNVELYEDEEEEYKPDLNDVIPSIKLNYELLEELDDEFHNGYENWRNMCFFMKNLNYPYDDFKIIKG